MPDNDELSGTAEARLRAEIEALRIEIREVVKPALVGTAILPEKPGVIESPDAPTAPGVVKAIRSPARGAPANLTQSDVDRLIRGDKDARLATRLASSPAFLATRPERLKAALFGPVSIELRDIEAVVSTGKTPEALTAALDASAKTPGRFGDIKPADASEKARPEFTPEER